MKKLKYKVSRLMLVSSIPLIIFNIQAGYCGQGDGIAADISMGTYVDLVSAEYDVTGGTSYGINLFHSFSDFNIDNFGVDFKVDTGANILNIIARVTGQNDTYINNTIKISGLYGQTLTNSVNLYLINPNGIFLDRDASLNITGSFHASTADYLKMEDEGIFYADLSKESVLTSSSIKSFGFIDDDIAGVYLYEPTLEVSEGETISITGGGTFALDNDENYIKDEYSFVQGEGIQSDYGWLIAPGGKVYIASVASQAEIELNDSEINITDTEGNKLSSNILGDIILTGDSKIKTDNYLSSQSVGQIFIKGKNFVLDYSNLYAKNISPVDIDDTAISISCYKAQISGVSAISASTLSKGDGGDINIEADNNFICGDDYESIISTSSYSQDDEAGNGGDISIKALNITFQGGSYISAKTEGKGDGGNISLIANQDIEVIGQNKDNGDGGDIFLITTYTEENAGDAGSLLIEANNITFTNGAYIKATTQGFGNAGDVILNAYESMNFNNSKIYVKTETTQEGAGDGGSLSLNAKNITFENISRISASTEGPGDGGNIELTATEDIYFSDSEIFVKAGTDTLDQNLGNAGTLTINAQNITFKDGSQILGETMGQGKGGDIKIIASNSVLFSGTSADVEYPTKIFIGSEGISDNAGNGGELLIQAKNITFENGTQISARTFGAGNGGNVTIKAEETALFKGASKNGESQYVSAIFIGTESSDTNAGDSGDLYIEAKNIYLEDGAYISGTTYGPGKAGQTTLNASNNIEITGVFENQSAIYARSEEKSTGRGGDIYIYASNILIDQGKITTQTESTGDAGDIYIYTDTISLANNASIVLESISNASGTGQAGDLYIEASQSVKSNNSSLNTESQNAGGGKITINADTLLYLNNSKITTSVQGGDGKGGDIYIDPMHVVLNKSSILANAWGGRGGNITILADYFMKSGESIIEASSKKSVPGTITITSPNIDVTSGLIAYKISFIELGGLIRDPCSPEQEQISIIPKTKDSITNTFEDLFSNSCKTLDYNILEEDGSPKR